jgi:putative restriction endonuclease
MGNAVFTASESSAYDDQIETHYHFPQSYLRRVEQAIGHWILYYEPRRNDGPKSANGRLAYFAMALVTDITPDPDTPGHHYAHVRHYTEFDQPVPFKDDTGYRESMLQRGDGETNRGAFGHSVRAIPETEFLEIVRRGISIALEPWEQPQLDHVAEPVPPYSPREVVQQLVTRKVRDANFRRHVRAAYNNTCAVTGLRLINGGGRPEVQAAHIRSVEKDGPDTVRNGIALTGTAHWLFDRGLMTFSDDYQILLSPHGVPDGLDKLILPERKLILPTEAHQRPHATYLEWHRENCFKH